MKDKDNIAMSNFTDFMQIVQKLQFQRDPTDFVQWLTNTDYFIAPGSSQYHDSVPGGLYNHSKRVYMAMQHLNSISKIKYSDEVLFFMSFGHDLAKVDCYKIIKKWKKDENNKWEQYEAYQYQENNPMPHGSKSAMLLQKYVKLTDDERLSIIYHMGPYHLAKQYMSQKAFYLARQLYPLVSMLHLADIISVDLI